MKTTLDQKMWQRFKRTRFEELDPVLRNEAVEALRDALLEDEANFADLRTRITEDPVDWLMGRSGVVCDHCDEDGYEFDSDAICFFCQGTKVFDEWPLHHGWGTAIRNFLRTKGFGEDEFGVENLDDYYVPLVEVALMITPDWMKTDE